MCINFLFLSFRNTTPKGESLTYTAKSSCDIDTGSVENNSASSFKCSDPNAFIHPNNLNVEVQSYDNTTSTYTNNKPALPLSMPNNTFNSNQGYFYPTQLSPIYEPDTESACSSNNSTTSPVHFPLLTNGLSTNEQYPLYTNNNKYIQEHMDIKRDSKDAAKEVSIDKNETKENDLLCDTPKSDITSKHHDTKSESYLKTSDVINGDETGKINDACDDKAHPSSMSFKSVFSAIQFSSSKKLNKFRDFQFTNSTPLVAPIVTINNDAIISSPFKTAFINQFKGGTKENVKEGEVQNIAIIRNDLKPIDFVISLILLLPSRNLICCRSCFTILNYFCRSFFRNRSIITRQYFLSSAKFNFLRTRAVFLS